MLLGYCFARQFRSLALRSSQLRHKMHGTSGRYEPTRVIDAENVSLCCNLGRGEDYRQIPVQSLSGEEGKRVLKGEEGEGGKKREKKLRR